MDFKPLRKKRLFEEIIYNIEQYIEENNLKVNDKLPSEAEFEKLFDVSKTTLREALSVLHSNGVITTIPGKGTFIKNLEDDSFFLKIASNIMSKKELNEILEFRRCIEIEAVALCIKKATDEELENILSINDTIKKEVKAGSMTIDEDFNFHHAIILASHNSIFVNIYQMLSQKIKECIKLSKIQSMKEPSRFVRTFEEHNDIINNLLKRDSEGAVEAMHKHLILNEQKIWEYFKEN